MDAPAGGAGAQLYGDQLHDPATVLALCVALGTAGRPEYPRSDTT